MLFDLVIGQEWATQDVDEWMDAFVYVRGDYVVSTMPQPSCHRDFDAEKRYLEEIFPEADHCTLGSKHQAQLNIMCSTSPVENPCPFTRRSPSLSNLDDLTDAKGEDATNHTLNMVEFVCIGLDQKKATLWRPENQAKAKKAMLPVWDAFCQGRPYVIDDFFFEPVGYSANLLCDGYYITVHITPQASCSYASLETNMMLSDKALKECYDALGVFGAKEIRQSLFQTPDVLDHQQIPPGHHIRQQVQYMGPFFNSAFRLFCQGPPMKPLANSKSNLTSSTGLTSNMGDEDNSSSKSNNKSDNTNETMDDLGENSPKELVERCIKRLRVDHLGTKAPVGTETNVEKLKRVGEHALRQLNDPDNALMLVDVEALIGQFERWRRLLPRVIPHYAVKCNPDPVLLRTLVALGAGFDCATKNEISLMLRLGVHPDMIVYANPCKHDAHIRHASERRVKQVVFDNVAELDKMKDHFPDADLLLRIATDDDGAQCPMSMKYGAAMKICRSLLEKAKSLNLNVAGVSFHVGSGCTQPGAFTRAITDAKEVFNIGEEIGFNMKLLDIGGGFPGSGEGFEAMTEQINGALELFGPSVRVIAEPGRYFAESTHTLLTKVLSRARVTDNKDTEMFRYYLNDGLYGSFNCIVYDHATVTPHLLRPKDEGKCRENAAPRAALFGPTCDGYDQIMEMEIPELQVGDWLLWENMGAYTTAAATNFNGFSKPQTYYYRS